MDESFEVGLERALKGKSAKHGEKGGLKDGSMDERFWVYLV